MAFPVRKFVYVSSKAVRTTWPGLIPALETLADPGPLARLPQWVISESVAGDFFGIWDLGLGARGLELGAWSYPRPKKPKAQSPVLSFKKKQGGIKHGGHPPATLFLI
jgi:hypothetical protein